MRAAVTHAARSMELRDDVPEPGPPGAGEVVVRIAAGGVNFIEIYQRTGAYPRPLPNVPGAEGAGREAKPDLEVLTVLPPFAKHPYGALLGLGSGSAPGRDRGFVVALAADGSLRGEPVVIDLGPLYRLLGEQIDGLNVEGGASWGIGYGCCIGAIADR
jgi:hypothetical protein